jgi:hypothetical protein
MVMSQTRTGVTGSSTGTIRLLQISTALSVVVLLWQFASAGQMLNRVDAEGGHGAGAIALHVVTALTLVGAVLHGRRSGTWWPAVLAGVVLLLTFVQAAVGSAGTITVHVPLALVITAGVVWLTAWAFRSAEPV